MNERERIEYLINLFGLTPSQFADRTGIPRASVSHILGGRNKPSLEIMQKVAAAFQSVDTNWLMLGMGGAPKEVKDDISVSNPNSLPAQRDSLFPTVDEPTTLVERPIPQQRTHTEEVAKVQKNVQPKHPVERVQRKTQRSVDEITVKKIKEIRVFYSDGTYEILYPEK